MYTLNTVTTDADYTVNVNADDTFHERPREAGRAVFCNYPKLAHESDTIATVIRKDAILVPIFLMNHSRYALTAVKADAFNEEGEARKNALQMIAEGLGRRSCGLVDKPDAVLGAARAINPYGCPWDSGLAGFYVFSRTDLRKHKSIEALVDIANNELDYIVADLNGDWAAFDLLNPKGEIIEGVCGFWSECEALDAGLLLADALAKEAFTRSPAKV